MSTGEGVPGQSCRRHLGGARVLAEPKVGCWPRSERRGALRPPFLARAFGRVEKDPEAWRRPQRPGRGRSWPPCHPLPRDPHPARLMPRLLPAECRPAAPPGGPRAPCPIWEQAGLTPLANIHGPPCKCSVPNFGASSGSQHLLREGLLLSPACGSMSCPRGPCRGHQVSCSSLAPLGTASTAPESGRTHSLTPG